MTDKQTTPMKKLSYNLRLLRQQLSNSFNILELTETQSHSYNYEYTKGVKSDYILIFTSKNNKEINFAFTFNYKGELESDYNIDVTIKEKDGDIKTINKFSYIKFKEILNNMVSLGIRDKSIINFILLLENVKDDILETVEGERKRIVSEYINQFKDSLSESKEVVTNECLRVQEQKEKVKQSFKNSEQYIAYQKVLDEMTYLRKKVNELNKKSSELHSTFYYGDRTKIINDCGYTHKKYICKENVRKHQQKIRKIENDIPNNLHKECVRLIKRELESYRVYPDRYSLEL